MIHQAVTQTKEEKIEMYMSLDKLKLAEMLVECNSHIKNFSSYITYEELDKASEKDLFNYTSEQLGDYITNLQRNWR